MATIRKLLDINTTHLPERVLADLNTYDGVVADETDRGWLVYVPSDVKAFFADYDELPPDELLIVLEYAAKLGCRYLLIDRESDRDPVLPYYGFDD